METVPQVINVGLIFCNYTTEWLNLGNKNNRNRQICFRFWKIWEVSFSPKLTFRWWAEEEEEGKWWERKMNLIVALVNVFYLIGLKVFSNLPVLLDRRPSGEQNTFFWVIVDSTVSLFLFQPRWFWWDSGFGLSRLLWLKEKVRIIIVALHCCCVSLRWWIIILFCSRPRVHRGILLSRRGVQAEVFWLGDI